MRKSVLVHWSNDKRKSLPASGFYSTLARFLDVAETGGDWSINLKFEPPIQDENGVWRAHAEFLASDAPTKLLEKGTKFEMLEGTRVTALVEIV